MDEKGGIGLYLYVQTYKEKSGSSSNQGIFAFFEKEIESEDFFIQEGCYLFRENNNIKVYKSHSEHGMNAESIFRVKVDNNHFKISTPFLSRLKPPFVKLINNLKNNLYYVMNSYSEDDKRINKNENDDYYLNENDIIKMGNMIYIVRKLFIKSNDNNNDNERDKNKDKVYDIESLNKDKSPIFDTCFMKKFDEKIISELTNIKEPTSLNLPKEAFYYCFHIINDIKDSIEIEKKKKYFNGRVIITETKNKNVTNYIFDLFKCEKCKETTNLTHLYPLRYMLPNDEKIYELIEIKEPENTNYLILESLEEIAQNEKKEVKENLKKYIHVVKLTEEGQKFYIGRGDKSDIKMDPKNTNVSSKHAVIIFLNGKVILKNISEKLNTSVLIKTIKEDLEIKEKEIYLEAGRSFIEAKIMTKEEYEKIKIK